MDRLCVIKVVFHCIYPFTIHLGEMKGKRMKVSGPALSAENAISTFANQFGYMAATEASLSQPSF